jgi:hypothetical protein
MSFTSSFRKFVSWLGSHKRDEFSAETQIDTLQSAAPSTSWPEGETQATGQLLNSSLKDAGITVGYFIAAYWDALLGGKKMKQNTGPVTGNNDIDALILSGGLLAILAVLWLIVKRIF